MIKNKSKTLTKKLDILKKPRGKTTAIIIDEEVRYQVRTFKHRLREMAESPDNEVREIDKKSIDVILNDLDEYDQNILIAYYAVANCSPTALGKLFGVKGPIIANRIKRIIKDVHNRISTNTDDSGLYC